MLETLPYNPPPKTKISEARLTFQLPTACCPVSKNPQEGSFIVVTFKPKTCVLEVGSFYAYLHSYVGGLKGDDAAIIVRDMEGMIAQIAHDTGVALQTNVKVKAVLNLRPFLGMTLKAKYKQERMKKR
jgi:hypothetical protein